VGEDIHRILAAWVSYLREACNVAPRNSLFCRR
jgi:hypothetical protein